MSKWFCFAFYFFFRKFSILGVLCRAEKNLFKELPSPIKVDISNLHVQFSSVQFSSFQSLICVRLFATPRIAARQAFLSITNSQSSLRLTSIESVMPSSDLILCRPLLLLPPIPPSIRVFSDESTLHMRWPKY